MMSIECEDQIEVHEYNLYQMPVESLKSLLNLVLSCQDCQGCDGQVKMLQRLIDEKEKQ